MKRLPALQLTALLVLFAWPQLPDPYLGWAMLPLWAMAGWLIFASTLETARLRRRVWLEQYLLPASVWHRWLRGGLLMGIWHMLVSALLALFMLVNLWQLDAALWLLLAAHLPLLWLSNNYLARRLGGHIQARFVAALQRRLLVPLNALVLLLAYVLISLLLSQPDMRGMNWADAITVHMQASESRMPLLAFSDRARQILELTMQWAMQNTWGDADQSGLLGLLAWSLLLLAGGAFIWAWIRMQVGIATLLSSPAVGRGVAARAHS